MKRLRTLSPPPRIGGFTGLNQQGNSEKPKGKHTQADSQQKDLCRKQPHLEKIRTRGPIGKAEG